MDPQFAFASREDIWRLHEDMKLVQSIQAEQADRLSRVERRQEDDARLKSVWASPFPGVLSGTPQQEPNVPPPGAEFPNFDGGESNTLLSGLHLDHDEEPRRGASRANSVRFDESAKHGHWPRASGEFYPARSGSGLGSHPMTERSSSHKSDGRHSSAGQSVHSAVSAHSARTNSLGLDTSFPTTQAPGTPFDGEGPSPGLLFLGPVPSIIRCWLDTNFSHESLLYAVVCTGASDSMVDLKLVHALGLGDDVAKDKYGALKIRLPVYLPEAVVKKASSRSNSPAPQLPTMTVDFTASDLSRHPGAAKSVSVFLGSDALRAHNADVLLSRNSISMLGDDHSQISIPLVRPEDECLFKHLRTTYASTDDALSDMDAAQSGLPGHTRSVDFTTPETRLPKIDGDARPSKDETASGSDSDFRPHPRVYTRGKSPSSVLKPESGTAAYFDKPSSHSNADARYRGTPGKEADSCDRSPAEIHRSNTKSTTSAPSESSPQQPEPASASSAGGSGIWSSWRRESSGASAAHDAVGDAAPTTSTSGYQRPSRGRGMKVLRPSKSSSLSTALATPSRSTSASFSSATQPPDENAKPGSSTAGPSTTAPSPSVDPQASPPKDPRSPTTSTPTAGTNPSTGRTLNPVGGASAFAWLKGGGPGKRAASASTPAQE